MSSTYCYLNVLHFFFVIYFSIRSLLVEWLVIVNTFKNNVWSKTTCWKVLFIHTEARISMIFLRDDDDDVFYVSYCIRSWFIFFSCSWSVQKYHTTHTLDFFPAFQQQKMVLRLFVVMFVVLPSLSSAKQFNYSCALEKPLQGKFHRLCCRRWVQFSFMTLERWIVLWLRKLDMISFSHKKETFLSTGSIVKKSRERKSL